MDMDIATHQARAYHVATPVYEGPLDLLLQLIERAELDITRLALAQVTDQYLEHLNKLTEKAAEEVSAFLVIASKLLQIKSEALLPRPPVREEGEEDPAEDLARQLLIYRQYKKIGQFLTEREAAGLRSYLRLAPPPKIEGVLDLEGLTASDLLGAALSAFQRLSDIRAPLGVVVAAPRVTIREKIAVIARLLRSNNRSLSFRSLIAKNSSTIEVVVTFLAVLELIKRRFVQVQQDALFGEIFIDATGAWDESASIELEFGE